MTFVLTTLNLPRTIGCTMSEGHYLKDLIEQYSKGLVANIGFLYILYLSYNGQATGLFPFHNTLARPLYGEYVD